MPLVRRLVTLDEEVSSQSFASYIHLLLFFNVKNGGKIAGTVNDFKQKC